jgi:hypothetical protein
VIASRFAPETRGCTLEEVNENRLVVDPETADTTS